MSVSSKGIVKLYTVHKYILNDPMRYFRVLRNVYGGQRRPIMRYNHYCVRLGRQRRFGWYITFPTYYGVIRLLCRIFGSVISFVSSFLLIRRRI